jgi:hypothetical protein
LRTKFWTFFFPEAYDVLFDPRRKGTALNSMVVMGLKIASVHGWFVPRNGGSELGTLNEAITRTRNHQND